MIKGHVRDVEGVHHCTVLSIKVQRLFMSEVLKVVFVSFTQHCIQSNVTHLTHVGGIEGVLCIQWPLTPARREGYLSLPSLAFSFSPPVSPRRQLC